jgi:hypothetical protein
MLPSLSRLRLKECGQACADACASTAVTFSGGFDLNQHCALCQKPVFQVTTHPPAAQVEPRESRKRTAAAMEARRRAMRFVCPPGDGGGASSSNAPAPAPAPATVPQPSERVVVPNAEVVVNRATLGNDDDAVVMLECGHAFHRSCLTEAVTAEFRLYGNGEETVVRVTVDALGFQDEFPVRLATWCPVCRLPITEANARELDLHTAELGRWNGDLADNLRDSDHADGQYAQQRAREESTRQENAELWAREAAESARNMLKFLPKNYDDHENRCECVLKLFGRPTEYREDVPYGGLQNALDIVTGRQPLEQEEAAATEWGRAQQALLRNEVQADLMRSRPAMIFLLDTHQCPIPARAVAQHVLKLGTLAHLWFALDPDTLHQLEAHKAREAHERGASALLNAWLDETHRPDWRTDRGKFSNPIRKKHYQELTLSIELELADLDPIEFERIHTPAGEQTKLEFYYVGETRHSRSKLAISVRRMVYNLQRVWQSEREADQLSFEWSRWEKRERRRRVFQSLDRVVESFVSHEHDDWNEWRQIGLQALSHFLHPVDGWRDGELWVTESLDDRHRRRLFDEEAARPWWRVEHADTSMDLAQQQQDKEFTFYERVQHEQSMDETMKLMLQFMIHPTGVIHPFALPLAEAKRLSGANAPQSDEPPERFLKLKETLRREAEQLLDRVKEYQAGSLTLKENENDRSVRTLVYAAVTQNGLALRYASPELKADRIIVLAAVRENGLALDYASPALTADRVIVLAAVEENGLAIQYASEELRNDHIIVYSAHSCVAQHATPFEIQKAMNARLHRRDQ